MTTPEKTQIFVEGRRQRTLEVNSLLRDGDTYILWFTLYYNEEILHERLFAVTAGEEGGDPNWLENLIGEQIDDEIMPSELNSGASTSDEMTDESVTSVERLPDDQSD